MTLTSDSIPDAMLFGNRRHPASAEPRIPGDRHDPSGRHAAGG